jgi:hypothetical protein
MSYKLKNTKNMKREKTLHREKLVSELRSIDSRLKFGNSNWNDAVKAAFNSTGSFDFVNLAYKDLGLVEELVMRFKPIR